jgi:phosphohistidine phosphatase
MIVYFLRHASAGESLENPSRDEKRALDKEGIEQCSQVGRTLAALDVHVDIILSSPLKRSAQTAALVGNEIGHEGKIQFDGALRPGATIDDFRALLDKQRRYEAIMVVGHNPNLSEFLGATITSGGGQAWIELKKGAVARVDLRRGAGELVWCFTPKIIRAVYATAADSVRPKSSRK